jgi:hypothetical protein
MASWPYSLSIVELKVIFAYNKTLRHLINPSHSKWVNRNRAEFFNRSRLVSHFSEPNSLDYCLGIRGELAILAMRHWSQGPLQSLLQNLKKMGFLIFFVWMVAKAFWSQFASAGQHWQHETKDSITKQDMFVQNSRWNATKTGECRVHFDQKEKSSHWKEIY